MIEVTTDGTASDLPEDLDIATRFPPLANQRQLRRIVYKIGNGQDQTYRRNLASDPSTWARQATPRIAEVAGGHPWSDDSMWR